MPDGPAAGRLAVGVTALGMVLASACSASGSGEPAPEPTTVITSVVTLTRSGEPAAPTPPAQTSPTQTPPAQTLGSPTQTLDTTPAAGAGAPVADFAACGRDGLVVAGSGEACGENAERRMAAGQETVWCTAPAGAQISHARIPYSVTVNGDQNQTNYRTIYPDSFGKGPGVLSVKVTPELMRLPGEVLPEGLYLCEWYDGETLLKGVEFQVGKVPEDDTGATAIH